MSNIQQPGGQAAYKVVQPFIHEHVPQIVGVHVALTERQAQHLFLGGFIIPASVDQPVTVVSSEPDAASTAAGKDGGKK